MKLDVRYLFPKDLQDIPLYDQVLYAVERIVSDFEVDMADSVEKYFDFDVLPSDLMALIVEEQGYKYIVDVLALTEDQVRTMTELITLIHFFKGHKTGLLLVLSILGFVGSETLEWWEQTPQGVPVTFKLTLNLNLSTVTGPVIPRLLAFIENYVYPVMDELILVADITDAEVFTLGTSSETIYCSIVDHL